MEPRHKLAAGETVTVELPAAVAAQPSPEAITLAIVYEDDDLIVINKPAGLVVHPGAGHETGTLVNALLAHCGGSLSGIGGVKRPGIVHRLDKDTSGLLVVAKTDEAHKGLSEQFAAHGRDGRLERAYLAFVWGVPSRTRGTVSAALARSPANRKKIAVSRGNAAKAAITHYRVVQPFDRLASLVECRLETGRTHQIRVHMAHIGHPLLSDPVYGRGFASSARKLPEGTREILAKLDRQALHATLLGFVHPSSGKKMRFESPLPADLQGLFDALKEPDRHVTRNKNVSKM